MSGDISKHIYLKPALFPVLNPFKPEFTIVINFYPLQTTAVTILDLQWMKMTWQIK